ncbi:MAG: type-F conjugative transfer system pilin assembly protein TrbC [Burkholderiales bacterium]|nr:type-F conjugative transfer system pilin assembly protein TrbC [Burkholderiales bacterium]
MPALTDFVGIALMALCAALPARAAEPVWPSKERVDHIRETHPFPDARAIERTPIALPPKINPGAAGSDIEALVRQHTGAMNPSMAQSAPSALRIFVTLDMPAASLRGLADQAARSGATLVLRGLKDNSMRATLARVQSLIGERHVAWQIDPLAFTRYAIERAPTFVLLTGGADTTSTESACTPDCRAPSAFVAIAGDVSLDYALEAMVRQVPSARPEALPYLTRLKGAP